MGAFIRRDCLLHGHYTLQNLEDGSIVRIHDIYEVILLIIVVGYLVLSQFHLESTYILAARSSTSDHRHTG